MAKAPVNSIDPIIGDLISETLEPGIRGTAGNEICSGLIPVHCGSRPPRRPADPMAVRRGALWALET